MEGCVAWWWRGGLGVGDLVAWRWRGGIVLGYPVAWRDGGVAAPFFLALWRGDASLIATNVSVKHLLLWKLS